MNVSSNLWKPSMTMQIISQSGKSLIGQQKATTVTWPDHKAHCLIFLWESTVLDLSSVKRPWKSLLAINFLGRSCLIIWKRMEIRINSILKFFFFFVNDSSFDSTQVLRLRIDIWLPNNNNSQFSSITFRIELFSFRITNNYIAIELMILNGSRLPTKSYHLIRLPVPPPSPPLPGDWAVMK